MNLTKGYTELIIDMGKKHGLLRNQLAYVLATAYWETAHTMKPVREAYWVRNAEAWRKKNLRYWPWYGRGFVQLTWEANYIRAGKELGVDFTKRPDDVMKPNYSAEILVIGSKEGWFTGKKLSDYITLRKSDFRNARRIINGMDKASTIAEIAREYDKLLKSVGYGEEPTPDYSPIPPEMVAVVDDAAADGRFSKTNTASLLGGVSTAAATARTVADDVGGTVQTFADFIPEWFVPVLLLAAVAAFGFVWWDRNRKKQAARYTQRLL